MERLKNWFNAGLVSIALLASAGAAHAQSEFTVKDEATGARQILTEDTARFTLTSFGDRVFFNVRDTSGQAAAIGDGNWYVTFVAPPGERLKPGLYPDVGCPTATYGRAAGLQVTFENPRCSTEDTIWGWIVIRQIDYDAAGKVVALEATYSQRVGSPDAPAWSGLLRYKASPLSLRIKAPETSPWGALRQHHHGDTSLFSLNGDASGMYYEASVIKDFWNVVVFPPTGQTLRPGRYVTRGEATSRFAGLNVIRGLEDPVYCPNSTGVLDIVDVALDAAGKASGLHARFEYRCDPRSAPMRGEVRFKR
ncbi:hypothetical protein ACFFGH_06075 [Lysobacter korlensis]|uniref:Uncharacterized protein n=1 Tax=Lysobacter korlensis TaxID=553636 RepID=A0ABV6RKA9_9GAMM